MCRLYVQFPSSINKNRLAAAELYKQLKRSIKVALRCVDVAGIVNKNRTLLLGLSPVLCAADLLQHEAEERQQHPKRLEIYGI